MPRLELRFFGVPRVTLDGQPVKLDRRKAEALLAYLLLEGEERRRSELAVLLWPEHSSPRGKAALRRALRTLTATVGKIWFRIDRSSVALADSGHLWADVRSFDETLARAFQHAHGPGRACDSCVPHLTEAVSLHRGDFLAGLTLRDAPGFDEWQFLQAERLRDSFSAALEGLVRFHVERGQQEQAVAFARRWVVHDPLDEASHETLMRIFVEAGKRGAALRLYDDFARRLERDLGIEPPRPMLELRSHLRVRQTRTPETRSRPRELEHKIEAWRRACQRRMADPIDRDLDEFCGLLDRGGVYHDGIELLDLALLAVDGGPLSGKILARQGALLCCIGRQAKARALLEAGLRRALEAKDCLEIGFCENRLGTVLYALGSYTQARRLLRSSVECYREAESTAGLFWALNVWGHLSIGTREARPILAKSLEGGRRAKDELRVASALNSLGKEALSRGSFASARENLERSLSLRREQGHRIGVADSLNNLGRAFLGLENIRASRRALEEALNLCRAIDARPLLSEVLLSLARVERAAGEIERSAGSAAAALHVPGAWDDAKRDARRVLTGLSRELPPAVLKRAIETGAHVEI